MRPFRECRSTWWNEANFGRKWLSRHGGYGLGKRYYGHLAVGLGRSRRLSSGGGLEEGTGVIDLRFGGHAEPHGDRSGERPSLSSKLTRARRFRRLMAADVIDGMTGGNFREAVNAGASYPAFVGIVVKRPVSASAELIAIPGTARRGLSVGRHET